MGMAAYKIEPYQTGWGVSHDGKMVGSYETKEAAFEATVAAASLALREGHAIEITAPGRDMARLRSTLRR
jgi:phosphotransferase system HPr-like phosphotransfer protein